MEGQFYSDRISKEQDGFTKVLSYYFSNKKYKNLRILNLCCGPITEEQVLFEYFGSQTEIISIDRDPQFEILAKEFKRKTFKLGDILALEKLVTGKFDIIFGRNIPLNPNHNLLEEQDIDMWPDLFRDLVNYMNIHSKLFLTFCRDDEYFRAMYILKQNKYDIKMAEENKIIVPSDRLGVAGADIKDNYVIMAQSPICLNL